MADAPPQVDLSALSEDELEAILAESRSRASDAELQTMSDDDLLKFAYGATPMVAAAPPIPVATFSKGVVKGIAALPDMLARGMGYGMGSAAELFGAPTDVVESLKNPQTIGGALDYFQPTAPNQELVERTGEGVGGALSGVGIGQLMAKYGAPVTAAIGETLASQPALQSVAGGTSGLSSAVAEEAGYGDFGQFVAGLAGGIVPVAAFPSIKTAMATLLSPLSSDFAKNGAAALLQRYSIDPASAVRSIQRQSDLNTLPGVAPTTAEVAGDAGLASLQRVLSNTDVNAAAEMSNRMQANMAARARAISQAAGQGDPEALIAAATARQNALEAATQQAGERVGSLNPPDVSGEALRAQLAERAKEAKAAVREKYRAVPEDAEPIQIGVFQPNDMRAPVSAPRKASEIADDLDAELAAQNLDPRTMRAEDWDAFYRDRAGASQPVTQDDVAFLNEGADRATGRTSLSPFQASLATLRRRFFPGAGLPANDNVSYLLRQLENADVMSARQVERIVSDLREQSGLLKMNDRCPVPSPRRLRTRRKVCFWRKLAPLGRRHCGKLVLPTAPSRRLLQKTNRDACWQQTVSLAQRLTCRGFRAWLFPATSLGAPLPAAWWRQQDLKLQNRQRVKSCAGLWTSRATTPPPSAR